jgi:hypothetical protein
MESHQTDGGDAAASQLREAALPSTALSQEDVQMKWKTKRDGACPLGARGAYAGRGVDDSAGRVDALLHEELDDRNEGDDENQSYRDCYAEYHDRRPSPPSRRTSTAAQRVG